jgi:hypothetical protein
MRARWARPVLILAVVASLVALTGCQSIVDNAVKGAVEKSTGVSVNGNKVTVQGKDGSTVVVGGTTTPDTWPKSVPVYSGEIKASGSFKNGSETDVSISLVTSDKAADVGTFYTDKLKADGWTITDSNTVQSGSATMASLTATKGNTEINVAAQGGAEAGKTLVTLVAKIK